MATGQSETGTGDVDPYADTTGSESGVWAGRISESGVLAEQAEDAAGSATPNRNSPATKTRDFIVVARAIGYDELLQAYTASHGPGEGRTRLSNEFGRIFPEIRNRTGLFWKKFVATHDRAYLTTESPEAAERIAVALIEAAQKFNLALPNPSLAKRFVVGITVRDRARPKPHRLPDGHVEVTEADDLTKAGRWGEVHLTEEVFKALPPGQRVHYGKMVPVGTRHDGSAVFGRRRVVVEGEPITLDRCVMSVDMCRFSQIQTNISVSSPDGEAVVKLSTQIEKIMLDGFVQAGGPGYQESLLKFGGDGGIFVFDEPCDAHAAAVALLERAEQISGRSRRVHVDNGMRCFRVGIVYGPMSRDANGKWVGDMISASVRLEAGGPSGEIRISPEAYLRLSEEARRQYGGEEVVYGKKHDHPFHARRCKVTERATWPETSEADGKPYAEPSANPEFAPKPAKPRRLQECFIISPIDPNNSRIAEVYREVIEPACRERGFIPRRADQIEGGQNPMILIARHLEQAPLAIAYLGRPNPTWNTNVMLEVGIRLATRRPIVLLSELPAAREDGTIPTFTDLLPYHLLHRSIIAVPDTAAGIVPKVARAIVEAAMGGDSAWTSPHPVTEVSFTNLDKDLRFVEVSPAALELFGEDHFREDGAVEEVRTSMVNRMYPEQFTAMRKDFRRVLREIQAKLSGFSDDDTADTAPISRVPLVFRDEADQTGGARVGYLPVITRFAIFDGVTFVRTLYMEVSRGLRLDGGIYVYDL